jgi:alkylation response protein AidB-like acyl-CoA dehydrogenase
MPAIAHPVGLAAPPRAVAVDAPRSWEERSREFAAEVVGPLGLVIDRLAAHEALAANSPLHELLPLANREGFTRLTAPVADGGAGLGPAGEYAVLEEFAAADAGLMLLLAAAPLAFALAGAVGDPTLRQRLAVPFLAGALPHAAGCVVSAADGVVRLARDGEGWRVIGSTRHTVTGAATATVAVVACSTVGFGARPALAFIPLKRPGVRRVAHLAGPGLRARAPASLCFCATPLAFDEVALDPRAERIAESLRAHQHLVAAVAGIGIARAAVDGAGRWRAEHGRTGAREIARMRGRLEIARGAVRGLYIRALAGGDPGAPVAVRPAATAHALAAHTATALAREAIGLCGIPALSSAGIAHLDRTRFHPEKLLRDALAGGALSLTRLTRPAALSAVPPRTTGATHGLCEDPRGDRAYRARAQPPSVRQRRDADR